MTTKTAKNAFSASELELMLKAARAAERKTELAKNSDFGMTVLARLGEALGGSTKPGSTWHGAGERLAFLDGDGGEWSLNITLTAKNDIATAKCK